MDSLKVKNFIIIVLLIVNAVLLAVVVSDALRDHVVAASIYDDVEGSDHCPVGLELDI